MARSKTTAPLYVISTSPHTHEGTCVSGIMLTVVAAMLPAFAAGVVLFGADAVRLVVVCVASCVLSEALCRRLMRREQTLGDCSAVVTGMLLAFNLPPGLPGWMAVVGSVAAIVVAKQVFGGIGYNVFNPALIGRVFLTVSFPEPMTARWTDWHIPSPAPAVHAVSSATPLGLLKDTLRDTGTLPFDWNASTVLQFFLGDTNGCLGEVSAAALLLGGAILLWKRCITWHIPAGYLGTVTLFSAVLWGLDPAHNLDPLFHLLSGGLMLGAWFMATDMVTSPVTGRGRIVFGAGCGLLTMLIRKWGAYPEGVSFSILLMNAATPLINRATRPRVFGHGKRS